MTATVANFRAGRPPLRLFGRPLHDLDLRPQGLQARFEVLVAACDEAPTGDDALAFSAQGGHDQGRAVANIPAGDFRAVEFR